MRVVQALALNYGRIIFPKIINAPSDYSDAILQVMILIGTETNRPENFTSAFTCMSLYQKV